ncbi:MAG: polyprenyl diphosphate synthase [Candidatus Woesearchaeota archaeon]
MAKPKHVGIILDGNRRFARRLMMEPWKGHEYGVEKVKKLVGWCRNNGIRELTLYALSMQNFNRPKREFDYLMGLFERSFNEFAESDEVHENKVRLKVIGRPHLLPEKVQEAIRKAEEATKDYDSYFLNLAVAYGGREEIIDAVKKLGRDIESGKLKPDQINQELFAQNLYMEDNPDLIIRTGGEQRTSNFLMWQSNYAEWLFIEKPWPEFEEEDFLNCISDYENRQRRFGK